MIGARGDGMSDLTARLGQRIRELRHERGMSQEELGFKSGISAAHLGQIERALKNPTVDTLGKIAAALEVPIIMLFEEREDYISNAYSPAPVVLGGLTAFPLLGLHKSPPPKNQSTTINKINAQLLDMTERQQKDILKLIRIFKGFQD